MAGVSATKRQVSMALKMVGFLNLRHVHDELNHCQNLFMCDVLMAKREVKVTLNGRRSFNLFVEKPATVW